MNKKVLLTINNNRLSGIERYTFLVAKYLNKSKYTVEVAIPSRGPLCDLFDEEKITYHIFNKPGVNPHSIRGVYNLFKIINKGKYDIIHAQAGIAPCIIGKFLSAKLVIEHKHGLDFTKREIDSMGYFKLAYQKLKKYFVDIELTGCREDKNTIVKRFGYDAEKTFVVYNGDEDIGIKNSLESGKMVIGTIGRLTYQKAQEYFIEAAKLILENGFSVDFRIYGGGENYDFYKKLIKDYGLDGKVKLMGYFTDINSAFDEIDVFVLTSRYEGIPFVLIEAMCKGIPIISSDVGGIKEIIKNGENGILYNDGDMDYLIKSITDLIENKDKRVSLGLKARECYMENYTHLKMVEQVERIYSSVEFE